MAISFVCPRDSTSSERIGVRVFHIAVASLGLFMATCAGGCASDDQPPTPVTASFNMQPVPKRTGNHFFSDVSHTFGALSGKTPVSDVRMMENQGSADERRTGIYNLVQRDFGQHDPYTRRYRQIAQSDADATVRAAAIRASNASRDREAIPVFIGALNDKSDLVRLQAAKALSNNPDPSATDPLVRVLGNQAETRDVRIAAAEALRHYRNPDVARVLIGVVGGRDFSLAWQSRWTLKILTGRDLGYDERAWAEFLAGPGKPLG
jgi:hypothetical protein